MVKRRIDLECGGKRYSVRRRFGEAKKSGAAPAVAGLSPHSKKIKFCVFCGFCGSFPEP
jgi:hypothetical protein